MPVWFWAACLLLLAQCSFTLAQTYTVLREFGINGDISGWTPLAALVQGADGTLYGTASAGQSPLAGTVYKLNPDGSGFSAIKWFTNAVEGVAPQGALVLADGKLYGTTYSGGSSNSGTVFRLNTDGTEYTVLHEFSGSDGKNPQAGVVWSGSVLYGTTYSGGSSSNGVVFRLNLDGTDYTVLHDFSGSDGKNPQAALVLSGSALYGTTAFGGSGNAGSVFTVNTDGSGFNVVYAFAGYDGRSPQGALVLADGTLYGTTRLGGGYNYGTVFSVSLDGSVFNQMWQFGGLDGRYPQAALVLDGSTLYGTTVNGGDFGYGTIFKLSTNGYDLAVLYSLAKTNGTAPAAPVILSGNRLYGTAAVNGPAGVGTIFALNTDGSEFSVIKPFLGNTDGQAPRGNLLLSGTTLYGTTAYGGTDNYGTVFKIAVDGSGYTVLKSFHGIDGKYIFAGLVLSGNTLYGAAYSDNIGFGNGNIFKLNTDGTGFSVLKQFNGTDGRNPLSALALSGNVLYGTTQGPAGNVFRVNTDGSGFLVLKGFTGADGSMPNGGVLLVGNTLCGATTGGGTWGFGTIYSLNTNGTGFKVLAQSQLSPDSPLVSLGDTLFGTSAAGARLAYRINMDGTGYGLVRTLAYADGSYPSPSAKLLVLDGKLYGTVDITGSASLGAIYSINPDGSDYTVLKDFTGGPDGAKPCAGVTSAGNSLFGSTANGGAFGLGLLYSLRLAPTVSVTMTSTRLAISWSATPGRSYQLEYKNPLTQASWTDLGAPVIATNWTMSASDTAGPDSSRFYRVVEQ